MQSLVDIIKHGLTDENQKVKTITSLSIAALAEAAAPYGIESFDDVLEPLWKGIRLLRYFLLLLSIAQQASNDCSSRLANLVLAKWQLSLFKFSLQTLSCLSRRTCYGARYCCGTLCTSVSAFDPVLAASKCSVTNSLLSS